MKASKIDFQSLSIFRILLAVFLACDFFASILPCLDVFYTNNGLFPLGNLALAGVIDHPVFHAVFIAAHLLGIFCFGIGYRTRLATYIVFATYAAIYWRAPFLNSGAEMVVRLLLLWSLFLPLSRYWSVDAALDPAPRDRPYPFLPVFVMKLQIAILYLFAALFKLAGWTWMSGVAVEWALRDSIAGGTTLGLYLAAHMAPLMAAATYGIIIFQFLFTPLIYAPWYNNYTRAFALFVAFLMHASFLVLLNVGTFPIVSMIYLVLLVPDAWWNALRNKWRQRQKNLRIHYDPACVSGHKLMLILREFCLPPSVPVEPVAGAYTWVVFDEAGRPLVKTQAVAFILRQSPVFWIFGWLMDKMPRQWNAGRWQRLAETFLPFRTQKPVGRFAQAVCAVLMVIAITDNVLFVSWQPVFDAEARRHVVQYEVPNANSPEWALAVRKTANWTQTQQQWNIFAPNPVCEMFSMRLKGQLQDGTMIDLMPRLSPPLFHVRGNGYGLAFTNLRISRYMRYLAFSPKGQNRTFQSYLCRQANDDPRLPPVARVITEVHLKTPPWEMGCTRKDRAYSTALECVP